MRGGGNMRRGGNRRGGENNRRGREQDSGWNPTKANSYTTNQKEKDCARARDKLFLIIKLV